jgi:hypothetical protein
MTGRGRMYRSEDEEQDLSLIQKTPVETRRIEKITVFYSDSSFQDFIAKE